MSSDVRNFDGLNWNSLRGPKGDTGPAGLTGAQGPQGIQGPPGQIGIQGIIIDLDNEQHSVPVNFDGTGGDWSTAISTATIYKDGADDSVNWNWQFPILSAGVQGVVSNNNRTFHVTAIDGFDNGTVSFVATGGGSNLQSKVFTVSKIRGGADGTPATVHRLSSSVAAVNKSISGVYNPPIVSFAGFSVTGSGPQIPYACRFVIDVLDDISGLWKPGVYISQADEKVYNFTVPPNTRLIQCSMYKAGGTSDLVDAEGIPITKDGQNGLPGASGITINLDNDNQTVATNADGTGGDYSTVVSTATVYSGTTDVSADWTFTTTTTGGIKGTATNRNRTYKVDSMDFDNGTVTFTAKKGAESISATFTLSKAPAGADGKPASIRRLLCSSPVVVKKKDGTLAPNPYTAESYDTTDGVVTEFKGIISCYKQVTKNAPYVFIESQNLAKSSFDLTSHTDALSFKFELKDAVTSKVYDWEIVPLVSDGIDGPPGPPGSGFVLDLTNDNHTVPTDNKGENGNYNLCSSTATLYSSGVELPVGTGANQVNYLPPVEVGTTGLVYTVTNNNRTMTVTSMLADKVQVKFQAVYQGITYSALWNISKAKSGASGQLIYLEVNPAVAAKNADGTFKVNTIEVKQLINKGDLPPANAPGLKATVYQQLVKDGAWTSIGVITTNPGTFNPSAYSTAFQFKVDLTSADGLVTYDSEIVPVLRDGSVGAQGPQGIQGIQGVQGPVGPIGPAGPSTPGARGPGTFISKVAGPWTDAKALKVISDATAGGSQVIRDVVTLYDSAPLAGASAYTDTRVWTGAAWQAVTQYLSGTILLDGTLAASALAANTVLTKGLIMGNFTGDNAAFLRSNGFISGNRGFQIDGAGNAEFYNVKIRGDLISGTGNLVQNSDGKQGWSNVKFNADGLAGTTGMILNHTQDTRVPWYENIFVLPQTGGSNDQGLSNRFTFGKDDDGNPYPTSPGKKYQLSGYMAAVGATALFYVDFFNSSGVYVSSTPFISLANGIAGGGRDLATNYALRFINFTVPAGIAGMKIVFRKLASLSGFSQSIAGLGRINLTEIDSTQLSSPIPWSPGGVSLINSGALAAQAANALTIISPPNMSLSLNSTTPNITPSFMLPFPKSMPTRSWAFVEISFDLVVTGTDNFVINCMLFSRTLASSVQVGVTSSQRVLASGQTMNFPVFVRKLVDLNTLYENASKMVELWWGFTGRGMASIKSINNISMVVQEVKR